MVVAVTGPDGHDFVSFGRFRLRPATRGDRPLRACRPAYEPLGIQVGSFVIRPELDQSLFNNSNVNGTSGGSSSWGSQTAASVTAQSDWTRNSLAASVGVNHEQYFSFAHRQLHGLECRPWRAATRSRIANWSPPTPTTPITQLGTAIGTIQSGAPVLNQTDTAQLDYTFNFRPSWPSRRP